MLNVAALFTSLFLMISGFFAGLPHAILVWDKPTEAVTDTVKVLNLYKEIAAKNTSTRFRENIATGNLVDGRNDFIARFMDTWAKAAMVVVDTRTRKVVTGVQGNLKALSAADIRNARAEYYHGGKTVVITFDVPEQVDKMGAAGNQCVERAIGGTFSTDAINSMKVRMAQLGYTLKSAQVAYRNASVMIRADVASGKIVAADYSYQIVTTAIRNETAQPFQQSFDFTRKIP